MYEISSFDSEFLNNLLSIFSEQYSAHFENTNLDSAALVSIDFFKMCAEKYTDLGLHSYYPLSKLENAAYRYLSKYPILLDEFFTLSEENTTSVKFKKGADKEVNVNDSYTDSESENKSKTISSSSTGKSVNETSPLSTDQIYDVTNPSSKQNLQSTGNESEQNANNKIKSYTFIKTHNEGEYKLYKEKFENSLYYNDFACIIDNEVKQWIDEFTKII